MAPPTAVQEYVVEPVTPVLSGEISVSGLSPLAAGLDAAARRGARASAVRPPAGSAPLLAAAPAAPAANGGPSTRTSKRLPDTSTV